MYVEFVSVLLSTESALIWILNADGASMNTRQLWVLEGEMAGLLIGFSMSPDGENIWTSHSWRKICIVFQIISFWLNLHIYTIYIFIVHPLMKILSSFTQHVSSVTLTNY